MSNDRPTPTYCEDCDHLHTQSHGGGSRWAMCSKFPRLQGAGFVTATLWDKDSPYMRCVDINGGACPLWTPRKETEGN